jgi:hypothetical protein
MRQVEQVQAGGGANRTLADRQVGGSSNVLHGEERSRDHNDHLHDANPPVFGHPDERPSDAPLGPASAQLITPGKANRTFCDMRHRLVCASR